MDLKVGDILHCSRDTFLSRVIKVLTNGDVSHTATVIENWGQIHVLDAQADGVYPLPLETWLRKYGYDEIEVARPIEPIDEKAFCIKAYDFVGISAYDYASLILRHPLSMITGRWFQKHVPDREVTCSELIGRIFNLPNAYRLTPQDVLNYTRSVNGIKFYHKNFEYTLD